MTKIISLYGSAETRYPGLYPDTNKLLMLDGLSEGLTSYWRLDETTGTTAFDEKHFADGTWIDGSWDASGKNGGCYYLNDGSSKAINLGNVYNYERTDPFSIRAWVKRLGSGTFDSIFSKVLGTGNYTGYTFDIQTSNKLRFALINAWGSNYFYSLSAGTVTDTNWHMYTVTYDGTSASTGCELYIDGTKQTKSSVGTLTSSTVTSSSVDCLIGSSENGSKGLQGRIDEVGMWNRALTEAEVIELYALGNGKFY